jgi:hypothetical protein
LEFYTPDAARSLNIEGVDVPIEYETTSALALTLEGAPIWDFEIAGFRSGDFAIGAQKLLREGLFMMRPHRTGRIPVVLVHGTASSPARWAELVNELENDPRFWENFEIWLFMYNTGNPIDGPVEDGADGARDVQERPYRRRGLGKSRSLRPLHTGKPGNYSRGETYSDGAR